VVLTNTTQGGNNFSVDFDYKGGAPNATNVGVVLNATTYQYVYTRPGRYKVLLVGSGVNASGQQGAIGSCVEVVVLGQEPPRFTATACAGNLVRLEVANDSLTAQYDQIEIRWGDGSAPQYINKGDSLKVSHTYTGVGTRNILVRGVYFNAGGCSGSRLTTQAITLGNTNLRSIRITRVEARDDGQVSLNYEGQEGIRSEIWVKSGGGAYASTGFSASAAGTQRLQIPRLNPSEIHCFKIRSVDACGNPTESPEVCTILLTAQAENERNVVSWNRAGGDAASFVEYQLIRDGTVLRRIRSIDELSYIDNNVQCGVSYRYQVVALTANAGDAVTSVSVAQVVTARSDLKPSTILGAYVTVNPDGQVDFTSELPVQGRTNTYRLLLERAPAGSTDFREISVLENSNRFTDQNVNTQQQSYCYRVSYENACGNRSDPSEAVCTVWLRREAGLLRWTSELPYLDALGDYSVIRITDSGSAAEAFVGQNTSYSPRDDDPDEQEFRYQIVSSSRIGFQSRSNILVYRRESKLFLPDAFSPNGDNINDVFKVYGAFVDRFEMIIYSRWGEVLFRSTDVNTGWDGTVNGQKAPEGSYVYKIEIEDTSGVPFRKSGTVLLLR
jgi:gliding motility-associated-like protein